MDSPISSNSAISSAPASSATAPRAAAPVAPAASAASPTAPGKGRDFSLSNLQVLLILLVCGVILTGVTWVVAGEFGRLPISLMDICTTVLQGGK